MFGFFYFLHHAVQFRGGVNIGVGISLVYFSVKTAKFLSQIVAAGQGF
jgi:hypothetical protein